MVKKKSAFYKIWHFLWEDNSVLSWIVNVILAFVLIKFLVYPGLGLVLGTTHPVVAVVSGSMEHNMPFDAWWNSTACANGACSQEAFYSSYNISKNDFLQFSFKNGFNTGDIMVLIGSEPARIRAGDVLVFKSSRPDPIIHRVIKTWQKGGKYYFQTKGDHNPYSLTGGLIDETDISEDIIIGKAAIRVPYLGWVKIGFVKLITYISSLK